MSPELLRKKYPKFIYKSFSFNLKEGNLNIIFDFRIPPDLKFSPKIRIAKVNEGRLRKIKKEVLENLILNLGMIESFSYWKATCSPEIEIDAGYLKKEQARWWEELILKGMGQFFFENKIDFTKKNFLKIYSLKKESLLKPINLKLKNRTIIPIGGGKDSIVTLELLKESGEDFTTFALNPTRTIKKIIKIGSQNSPLIVERKIDPKILKLNQKGYLNGHTPFSAYLAFLSVLCAVIFDFKYIAFSQERSSNEGNVKYLGKTINHQYSKSFEFEKKFREYLKKYLVSGIEYFSFLRPLYELQISKLFSKYSQYFPIFLSCNEAYKTYSGTKKPKKKWCGQCSKCLFIYSSLYPFIEDKELIEIFGEDLFEKRNLLAIMQELIGQKGFKPFECVGTKKESLIAFYLSWKKAKANGKQPFLLKYFEREILPTKSSFNFEKESKKLMESFGKNHFLPPEFQQIFKKKMQTLTNRDK